MAGFDDTGVFYNSAQAFIAELRSNKTSFWRALKGVCLHHTGFPDLRMRKQGFRKQLMENIEYGYRKNKGWTRAPHLFIDEDEGWGMTPTNERGIHAIAFNKYYLGFEVLGDYNVKDDPFSGRGAACWAMASLFTACVLYVKGWEATNATIKFHREDKRTSKTCPGRKIDKAWFIKKVAADLKKLRAVAKEPTEKQTELIPTSQSSAHLSALEYQVQELREDLQRAVFEREEHRAECEQRLDFIEWRARKLAKN